jgi:hypothetical protein
VGKQPVGVTLDQRVQDLAEAVGEQLELGVEDVEGGNPNLTAGPRARGPMRPTRPAGSVNVT